MTKTSKVCQLFKKFKITPQIVQKLDKFLKSLIQFSFKCCVDGWILSLFTDKLDSDTNSLRK